MGLIRKLAVVVIAVLLLSVTAYGIYYFSSRTSDDHDHQNENDTEPPTITFVTGNTKVTAGQTVTISARFSDNVGVTEATLYYKPADASSWSSASILSGNVTLSIPATATTNYYYYVTVNDAVGNGPVGDPSADGSLYYTITVQPTGDHGHENLTHTVFLEEATATWCTNCPNVANILYSIYDSHKYNFYYVALINDTKTLAPQRNWNEYHVWGFPTVYFDGGYRLVVGANNPKSAYTDALNASLGRAVPKIKLTVTATNTTQDVTVTTLIENRENTTYTGRLRLYLTEIISQINDYDNKPYHFGFIEYLNNTQISVPGQSNLTIAVTKNISTYDSENLMIIGVLFSSQKHTGYSQPPDQNPFDAYYADATNATKVVPKGNLPPLLQITSPQKGNIYWNGKPLAIVGKIINRKHLIKKFANISLLKNFLHNKIYLLGKNKIITVDATDDSAVAKVEFYLDGTLQYTATKAPYEWSFTKLSKFKLFAQEHTLKVIAYDDANKTSSASLVFKAHF